MKAVQSQEQIFGLLQLLCFGSLFWTNSLKAKVNNKLSTVLNGEEKMEIV